jgi:hypothetical protein
MRSSRTTIRPANDFGAFDHAGKRIFWKIDYYDQALEYCNLT